MLESNSPQNKRKRDFSDVDNTDSIEICASFGSADPSSKQAGRAEERDFSSEFVNRVAELRKRFPGSPFCPGGVREYATLLSKSHPYSGSSVSSGVKSSTLTNFSISNPSESAAEILKRFPSVIGSTSKRISDNAVAKDIASSFVREIKRRKEAKEIESTDFNAYKTALAAEDKWGFSDAEDFERLCRNARIIYKKSQDLLFKEETRLEGVIQLVRCAATEAKALEAFRLDHRAPQEIFKRFKAFFTKLCKLRAQITIHRPPKFILALVELMQSSISFKLASLTRCLIPKPCDVDAFKADLESFLSKATNCWLNFSKLLSTSNIQTTFPRTWGSISGPLELEDGEEASHSPIVYPLPSLQSPGLTSVILFVYSILEEASTNRVKS